MTQNQLSISDLEQRVECMKREGRGRQALAGMVRHYSRLMETPKVRLAACTNGRFHNIIMISVLFIIFMRSILEGLSHVFVRY